MALVAVSTLVIGGDQIAAAQRPPVEHIVNTIPQENGSVCCFGGRTKHLVNEINTVGQTIRLTASTDVLRAFAFRLHGAGHARIRGYVYRWSPAKHHAVGDALYRSESVRMKNNTWKNYRFRTSQLQLRAGRWYVAFISVSEIRHHSAAGGTYCATPTRSLPGKQFRMGNGYDEGQWTRKAWRFDDYLGDMCMKLRSTN
jgi:hypothetical protein